MDSSHYIPQKILSQRSIKEWETDIVDEYMDLVGKTKEEATHIYLSYVKQLPFYGTTFFSVSHSLSNSPIPSQFELAINIEGIHFVDSMTKVKSFYCLRCIPSDYLISFFLSLFFFFRQNFKPELTRKLKLSLTLKNLLLLFLRNISQPLQWKLNLFKYIFPLLLL